MFFETNQGDRYIAKSEIRSAPSDDLPFGAWSFSYINGGTEQSPTQNLLDVTDGGLLTFQLGKAQKVMKPAIAFEITQMAGESLTDLDYEAGKIR